MTPKAMQKVIRAAWGALDAASGGVAVMTPYSLDRCLDASIEVEKGHRAMGRRFTSGRAAYCLNVRDTARLFVMKYVYEPGRPMIPSSWQEVASTPADVVLCYAFREALIAKLDDLSKAFPDDAFCAIEYARDVAR